MSTAARVTNGNAAHFYTKNGKPMHFVERSDGKGTRPTTLRDARKLGLLPSPTSILKVLRAPALEAWLIENACLAVLTAPRREGEELDAFVKRVLQDERQQDEQAQKARDLGTAIHDAIATVLIGEQTGTARECPLELAPFVYPAIKELRQFGKVQSIESVVVGDGYAGRMDCSFRNEIITVVDLKTTGSKLPTTAYWEHQLQTASYSKAVYCGDAIQTAVLYINTKEPGQLSLCINEEWQSAWTAFGHLLHYWQLANDYTP